MVFRVNAKQIKQLSKMLKEKTDRTIIKEEDYKMYMDPSNVMGIIPKTIEFRDSLVVEFDVESVKVQDLEYTIGIPHCRYSVDYLTLILEFMKLFDDEKIELKLKQEYPLWVEMEQFIIILAPRSD